MLVSSAFGRVCECGQPGLEGTHALGVAGAPRLGELSAKLGLGKALPGTSGRLLCSRSRSVNQAHRRILSPGDARRRDFPRTIGQVPYFSDEKDRPWISWRRELRPSFA